MYNADTCETCEDARRRLAAANRVLEAERDAARANAREARSYAYIFAITAFGMALLAVASESGWL